MIWSMLVHYYCNVIEKNQVGILATVVFNCFFFFLEKEEFLADIWFNVMEAKLISLRLRFTSIYTWSSINA